MVYGPIVVDDTSGKFVVTSKGVDAAAVAAQLVKDLAVPVVVPPPVVTPPASSAVIFAPIKHVLNDWSPEGQVSLGGKQWYVESSMKPYAAQLSTNTTSPIFRGEVRNNELWSDADGGNDTERAELDGSPTTYPKGTEFWFSYQFKVEPGQDQIATGGGFPGGPLAWGCIGQVHGEGGSLPAVPWQLSIIGDKLSVRTQKGEQDESIHWTSASKFARDKVYSVVAKLKITGTAASTMTVWIDGVQVCQVANKVIGGNDPRFYPKVGIYRGWQGDGYPPLAVQVANVEHGTATLLARVANPLPWPAVK